MPVNIRGRHFLKLLDYSPAEIRYLLDLAKDFKAMKRAGTPHRYLEGKNIVLLFEKTSTRTRCSFEVAGYDLGMGVTYLDPGSSQMGKKESIADTARVLGRMYDGIEYRGFSQELVEELAKYAGVPVWNGLTDQFHPTQMLADLLTMEEKFGYLKGLRFTYMGDARNNMGNSLMIACAKMGVHFTACAPRELFPAPELVEQAQAIARENELQLMQAQINPHFVYNTLDSINWLALMEGNEEISRMILALGHLLRSSISTFDIQTTVREEVEKVHLTLEQENTEPESQNITAVIEGTDLKEEQLKEAFHI